MNERKVEKLLERLVIAVERLAQINPPRKKPTDISVAGLAHVVGGSRRSDEPDDRGLTRGGTPPEEFFARRD